MIQGAGVNNRLNRRAHQAHLAQIFLRLLAGLPAGGQFEKQFQLVVGISKRIRMAGLDQKLDDLGQAYFSLAIWTAFSIKSSLFNRSFPIARYACL